VYPVGFFHRAESPELFATLTWLFHPKHAQTRRALGPPAKEPLFYGSGHSNSRFALAIKKPVPFSGWVLASDVLELPFPTRFADVFELTTTHLPFGGLHLTPVITP